MEKPTVFVVSADAAVRDSVTDLVESAGLHAETFPSLRVFLDAVEPDRRGCLVFEAQIDDLNDPEQQARIVAACAILPGLLITDRGDVPSAARAIKSGAMDVVQKPYRDQHLLYSIEKALQADTIAHG